ncbi:MAG: DUF1127 domain-containing protein [Albidovulum sp.]|uniref:DUF1127 domain-containing protein n=1 Tax=Albidovulum sp. TaxID=1872424 RepID=UPI003CC13C41
MEHLLPRTHRQVRSNLLGWLSKRIELHRQRRDLSGLTEHRLTDIGISKDQARTEAGRPIWDVPETWRG